jgi:hypothetical protein
VRAPKQEKVHIASKWDKISAELTFPLTTTMPL